LPRKHEALSSTPSTAKTKNRNKKPKQQKQISVTYFIKNINIHTVVLSGPKRNNILIYVPVNNTLKGIVSRADEQNGFV
jgi:hypothetical protein